MFDVATTGVNDEKKGYVEAVFISSHRFSIARHSGDGILKNQVQAGFRLKYAESLENPSKNFCNPSPQRTTRALINKH